MVVQGHDRGGAVRRDSMSKECGLEGTVRDGVKGLGPVLGKDI